jgi:hypothetical protein
VISYIEFTSDTSVTASGVVSLKSAVGDQFRSFSCDLFMEDEIVGTLTGSYQILVLHSAHDGEQQSKLLEDLVTASNPAPPDQEKLRESIVSLP